MADTFKYAQLQNFSLAGSGAISGATSITLKSFQSIDGVNLAMTDFGSIGFGTLEPGNGTSEEQISFTGVNQNSNGTATLTGVSNVLFLAPYTATSGLSKTHAGSTTFIISNTAGFYDRLTGKDDDETITGLWNFPSGANNPTIGTVYAAPTTDLQIATKKYVDDVAIFGSPKATATTYGISKLSLAAVDPLIPIVVGDNDTRVPTVNMSTVTANQVAALTGTGTPNGTTGKYVTNDDTSATSAASKVYRMTAGGAIDATLLAGNLPAISGASLTGIVQGYVGALTITSSASTQNIDTAFTCGFVPRSITIYYTMDGQSNGSGTQYTGGTAFYDGAGTLIANQAIYTNTTNASLPITRATITTDTTLPSAGGATGSPSVKTAISIPTLTSTGFTVRVAYTGVAGGTTGHCTFLVVVN